MCRAGGRRCYHRRATDRPATLGVTALDPKPPDPSEPPEEAPTPPAAPEPAPETEPTDLDPTTSEPEPAPETEPTDLDPTTSEPEPAPDPAPPTAADTEPTPSEPGPAPDGPATPAAGAASGPNPAGGSAPKPPPGPPPGAKPPPKAKTKKPKPPGLREQLGKTAQAAATLVMAHVDLAKEEASEIGREGGRLAGLFAAAVGLVIIAAILAIIGTSLFLGEWLLGSIGWGVLHGVLLFVTGAVALVLLALRVEPTRIARAFLVGLVVAVLTSAVLGLGLLNQAYASIGESLGLAVDPAYRPLVVGMGLGAILGLLLAIILAVRATSANWFVAIAGGIVFGVAAGAFTAITFGPQVGTGIGVTVGYLTWAGLMALDVYRTGIDVEGLKARFIPTMTIETSKETLEWLKERTPRGNGS